MLNIKKEVTKIQYDIVQVTYTNEATGQKEVLTVTCEPKNLKRSLKRFDLALMKRFKDEENPSR